MKSKHCLSQPLRRTLSLGLCCLLGGACFTNSSLHAAPILLNGSFEANGSGAPNHWTLTDVNGFDNVLSTFGRSDGANAMRFNGGSQLPDAVLSQNFTTFAGQTYYAEFDMRKYGAGGANLAQLLAEVRNTGNNALLGSVTASDASGELDTGLTQNYTPADFSFTATGVQSRISFTDQSTNNGTNFDAMLDRVSINVIRNGSFEQGLTGWSLTGNAQVTGISNGIDQGESNGLDAIRFNHATLVPNAVLSQTFSTLDNGLYSVEFDFRKFATGTGTAALNVEVRDTATNTVLASLSATDAVGDSGTGQIPSSFLNFDFDFLAIGSQTTLYFLDVSTNSGTSFDGRLDNVLVTLNTVVPEPTTFVLLCVAGLGLGSRRLYRVLRSR